MGLRQVLPVQTKTTFFPNQPSINRALKKQVPPRPGMQHDSTQGRCGLDERNGGFDSALEHLGQETLDAFDLIGGDTAGADDPHALAFQTSDGGLPAQGAGTRVDGIVDR